MRTKAEQLLSLIIGKAPWCVRKLEASFVVFDFGRKQKGHFRTEGTYMLWVTMANWTIRRNGKELAHSESAGKAIEKAARCLEGEKLTGIILKKYMTIDGTFFGARLEFDHEHMLNAIMYADKECADYEVFMLRTPEHRVHYNYKGKLIATKAKPRAQ